ncbi:hypothetical protein Tco_0185319 [Tanacetum coccineum]
MSEDRLVRDDLDVVAIRDPSSMGLSVQILNMKTSVSIIAEIEFMDHRCNELSTKDLGAELSFKLKGTDWYLGLCTVCFENVSLELTSRVRLFPAFGVMIVSIGVQKSRVDMTTLDIVGGDAGGVQ